MTHYPENRVLLGPYTPFNGFERAINKIAENLSLFSAILIGILVVPICLDVALRALDIHIIEGVVELECVILSLIAFSAMAITFVKRAPLQIDIVYNLMRPKWQCRLDFFTYFLCTGVCMLLAYEAFVSSQKHMVVTHVLELKESYFILFTSAMYFIFSLVFLFLLLHVAMEMKEAHDFFGMFLAILGASFLIGLPVAYRMSDLYFSSLAIGGLGFLLLIICLLLRMPIGFTMIIIGILGSIAVMRSPWAVFNVVGTMPFRYTSEYLYVALPTFMLMGEFIYHSGLSKDLFDCANKWLGCLPGGLASASVAGCAGFGAVCGESLPTVVTMSTVAYPAMQEQDYAPSLACGALAAGGTLGILIPPSIGFIFYSLMTEVSIAKLFVAGIIPGILLATIFITIITIQVKRNPNLVACHGVPATFREKMESTFRLFPIVIIFIIVVGGILEGFFTPGEGGAVGAGTAFIYALMRRKMTVEILKSSLLATADMCGKVFVILVGVGIFGNFLASSRLPMLLASAVTN